MLVKMVHSQETIYLKKITAFNIHLNDELIILNKYFIFNFEIHVKRAHESQIIDLSKKNQDDINADKNLC